MKQENILNISKLDAAKRQLEIAIRLFMNNSDIVAIHSLTAAAHEIFRDLLKKHGQGSYLKDTLLQSVKPEHQKRFSNKINEAENFFKHADKDHDKLLPFIPETTEFMLWDACSMYQTITTEHTPLILIYRMWFFTKHPDILADSIIKAKVIESSQKLGLDPNNRAQFLAVLPEVTKFY